MERKNKNLDMLNEDVCETPGMYYRERLLNSWFILRKNRFAVFGGATVLVMIIIALFAPLFAPFDPNEMDSLRRLEAPSLSHFFGTDRFGRDVLSQVFFGARVSLLVGFSSAIFATIVGIVVGLISGYFKKLDYVIMRVMDGMMAFPSILLAIAIMAALGPRISNIIIALGVVYMPRTARICRGVVLVVRELGYVEAAVASGASNFRIIYKHVLPNCLQPVNVQATFIFAYAILAEAALSFLGVGVPPDVPSWGAILNEGRAYMQTAPWLTVLPGITIMLTVMGLNLLGDGMRDLIDPQLKQ